VVAIAIGTCLAFTIPAWPRATMPVSWGAWCWLSPRATHLPRSVRGWCAGPS